MSYQKLRTGRLSETGRAYFITTVTQHRIPLFDNLYCARIVINNMRKIHDAGWVNSLSWVVMPDHVHWLFQLSDMKDLSIVIKHFKARSAQQLNKRLSRSGRVWQKAFYDRALRDGEDLQQVARYIVANSLRVGLVENIEDYSHWDAVWL
jgi:REP element-mobilizing transposase RayT